MITIENYNTSSTSLYQLAKKIIQNTSLSSDLKKSSRETLFIEDICKRVEKSQSVLYVLKNDVTVLGLVAISATAIEDHPSILIDYIFVNEKVRGQELEMLENTKPFRYLIEMIISISKDLQKQIGIRYIVLLPDNDDLQDKYKKLNFEYMNGKKKRWMYFKI